MKKEIYKKLKNRLNRTEGQIRGITSMLDRDEYYTHIITQISAVKSALVSIENILIEEHLDKLTHDVDKQTQTEIMKIFKSRKLK